MAAGHTSAHTHTPTDTATHSTTPTHRSAGEELVVHTRIDAPANGYSEDHGQCCRPQTLATGQDPDQHKHKHTHTAHTDTDMDTDTDTDTDMDPYIYIYVYVYSPTHTDLFLFSHSYILYLSHAQTGAFGGFPFTRRLGVGGFC